MKKPTIKAMIENSSIPAALIRAVIRQFGGFEYFSQSAPDVARHGAAGGFSGFIYHSDTVAFTKRQKKNIIEYAEEQAKEFGEDGLLSMLAHFNYFKGMTQSEIADGLYNPRSDEQTTIFNGLAWYALEEVARVYDDLKEEA